MFVIFLGDFFLSSFAYTSVFTLTLSLDVNHVLKLFEWLLFVSSFKKAKNTHTSETQHKFDVCFDAAVH